MKEKMIDKVKEYLQLYSKEQRTSAENERMAQIRTDAREWRKERKAKKQNT